MTSWDVAVIGAGAAGLLAATRAAERGRRTVLIEKNRRPGVKILMSGGTRCNLTQDVDARAIVEAFGPPGRFLHSALAALGPRDLVDLVEAEGVPTKVEATGKIFPVSDRATDVLAALLRRLRRSGCALACGEAVRAVERAEDGGFRIAAASGPVSAPRVIVTSGGRSYPRCGTSGDGYGWAARLGHAVTATRPALVPLTTDAAWVRALKGVTVPDVDVRVAAVASGGGVCARRRAGFLFTHFGLSGPVILDVSRVVSGHARPDTLVLECDFLPELKDAELDGRLRGGAVAAGRKTLANLLDDVLPRRLREALLAQAGLFPDARAAGLSRADRARWVGSIKRQRIPLTGTLGFAKAEVTAGGVALDEIDSRTMESKLAPGLFFAGEILDLDGPIGGYNFQAAFSTGWAAGGSV